MPSDVLQLPPFSSEVDTARSLLGLLFSRPPKRPHLGATIPMGGSAHSLPVVGDLGLLAVFLDVAGRAAPLRRPLNGRPDLPWPVLDRRPRPVVGLRARRAR